MNVDRATVSPTTFGRRQLLQTGGLTITLGALVAACGDSAAGEPGRVGYAPPVTPLPTVEIDDVVYLRTAMSIEQTAIDVYAVITESGALDADQQAMVDRLVADHEAALSAVSDLTTEAGGEPFECANAWYLERVIDPIVVQIVGDGAGIPPSDQPARDMLVVVNAMESMMGAMYQQMVELLSQPELRAEVMVLGAEAARHAAAVAILVTGAPEGYASPAVSGEEVEQDEAGATPIFAIPTLFGSLAAVPVTVGALSEAGTRFSTIIETPADNSFVDDTATCDA